MDFNEQLDSISRKIYARHKMSSVGHRLMNEVHFNRTTAAHEGPSGTMTIDTITEALRKIEQAAPMPSIFNVVPVPWLLETSMEPRGWRERLFSWPWRPWRRQKVVHTPSLKIHRIGGTFYAHPAVVDEIVRHTPNIRRHPAGIFASPGYCF